MPYRFFIPLLLIIILSAACGEAPAGVSTSAPEVVGQSVVEEQPAATEPSPSVPFGASALAPEPQEIIFQASDGQGLQGIYYPAAVNPAPVVVLMHWVGGDKSDWYEIAAWLQNRGLENPFTNPADMPWWDPSWFPSIPEGTSYGVFIFSFRGCEPYQVGCENWTPDVWLLDARAAVLTATQLEGADPSKIIVIGSSIGADGAPDSCLWLNEQQPGSCQGALSLSPGGYMDIPYSEAVQTLGENQPPVAAWCLADETEFGVCEAAETTGNPVYKDFVIPDGQHGNMLLRPGLTPLPMQVILDFLADTVGP